MRTIIIYIFLLFLFTIEGKTQSDKVLTLALSDAVRMGQEFSLEAQAAKHTYMAAYWNYRFFRANYLPSVTLSSSPSLNKEINKITQPDGTNLFLKQNQLNTNLQLKVNQNVALTGGSFFVKSSLQRLDEFEHDITAYNSQPFVIGYEQSLLGHNYFRWERKVEPLRFREAAKAYSETLELIASQACNLFFNLATAQTNLDIASFNQASADTLYSYAIGRYNIGTITENEMLQLEINKLTEETNRMNASIEVEDQMQTLRSFLGLDGSTYIKVVTTDSVPFFEVEAHKALQRAIENNPEPESNERRKIESRSALAAAKAASGLKADLYVQFGLSQTADKFRDSYHKPMDQQYVSLGLSFPLLDWGRGKGRVKVARSNMELIETQTEQAMKDFELNVYKMVRQFNLQAHRVAVAYKTSITAEKRNDVARRLYLLGKSTILDLNASITEKDSARRAYISTLKTFWSLYYGIRSMTGYDFMTDKEIEKTLPET